MGEEQRVWCLALSDADDEDKEGGDGGDAGRRCLGLTQESADDDADAAVTLFWMLSLGNGVASADAPYIQDRLYTSTQHIAIYVGTSAMWY